MTQREGPRPKRGTASCTHTPFPVWSHLLTSKGCEAEGEMRDSLETQTPSDSSEWCLRVARPGPCCDLPWVPAQ